MKTEKMVLKEASNVSLPGTPFLGHRPKNHAKVALKEEWPLKHQGGLPSSVSFSGTIFKTPPPQIKIKQKWH